jgi:hypothetical protein
MIVFNACNKSCFKILCSGGIIAPNINISQYILEDKEEELMELLARESLTDPSIISVKTTVHSF